MSLTRDITQRPPREPIVAPGQIDHHTADMTVTAAADVTLAALDERLAPHNQWFPIDGDHDAALGDLVLRNSTGPLRLGYGAWRDLLLGMQFTNGRGELISAGGRVLKNVAGYDLTKFIVGSFGVFGTPVTLTVRTYRRPTAAALIELPPSARIDEFGITPSWAILRRESLVTGFVGDQNLVDFVQSKAQGKAQAIDLEADARFRAEAWNTKICRARIVVPPNRVRDLVDHIDGIVVDRSFGVGLLVTKREFSQEQVRETVAALRGHVTFFGDDGRPLSVSVDEATYALLQRLKASFDPDNVLPPLPPRS